MTLAELVDDDDALCATLQIKSLNEPYNTVWTTALAHAMKAYGVLWQAANPGLDYDQHWRRFMARMLAGNEVRG